DLMTSGNSLPAPEALKHHIIDEVIEGDLRAGALDYARRLLAMAAPLRRIRDIRIDPDSIDADFFAHYRSKLNQRARGQIAPDRIVSCVEAAVNLPMDAGLARERALFMECLQ